MSSQLQNNTRVNSCLDSIASQPMSLEAIVDSGGAVQHIFPQSKDVKQVAHFKLSETAEAFDSSIDDQRVSKYPAFEPTVSSLSVAILDEYGSATSGSSTFSSKSLIIPSQNHLFLEPSHRVSTEATLANPMPINVTLEHKAAENLTHLSPLPLDLNQVFPFHSQNSARFKSQILDNSHDQSLSTNEFGNQSLNIESLSLSHSESDIVSGGQSQAQIDSMHLTMPSPFPNFYKIYSRRSKLSPSIAYMHVAILLGITLEDLANVKPSSPFYRQTTTKDDPKALLAAAVIPSLPAHLQPTLPQILFPHNPNLDLLPFPVLRARAITLAATTPQLVDPKELKMDILSDGLICWHDWNGDNNGFGQPWDIHSWEAASWFKKKWRMLFEEDSHYMY